MSKGMTSTEQVEEAILDQEMIGYKETQQSMVDSGDTDSMMEIGGYYVPRSLPLIALQDFAQAVLIFQGTARLAGYSSPFDIWQAIDLAKSLNKPLAWILANYSPSKGKMNQSAAAAKCFAAEFGLEFNIIEDYKALYVLETLDGAYRFTEEDIRHDKRYTIYRNRLESDLDKTTGTIRLVRSIDPDTGSEITYDWITTIEGTITRLDGTKYIQQMSYRLSEAQKAGLLDKDNWKNYDRDCMKARCYQLVIRHMAPNSTSAMFYLKEEIASPDNEVLTEAEIIG